MGRIKGSLLRSNTRVPVFRVSRNSDKEFRHGFPFDATRSSFRAMRSWRSCKNHCTPTGRTRSIFYLFFFDQMQVHWAGSMYIYIYIYVNIKPGNQFQFWQFHPHPPPPPPRALCLTVISKCLRGCLVSFSETQRGRRFSLQTGC